MELTDIKLEGVHRLIREKINSKPHTISILRNMTIETPPREVFQWRANTGEPYSPAMTSLADCQDWPVKNGLSPVFE